MTVCIHDIDLGAKCSDCERGVKTHTRIDAGTGRVYPLDDSDWPDNNRGEDNMTGIYSPPLLAEELKEIVLALRYRSEKFAELWVRDGDEKAKRQAKYLLDLARRLELTKPQA